jgi:hypothetical protein
MSKIIRFWQFGLTVAVVSLFLIAFHSKAQDRNQYGERTIEPEQIANDKDGIWTLNFRFKDPRIIIADVPARGKKVIWYMWYQVYNYTGEPRQIIPRFELVTLDKNTVHVDEVMPSVIEEISKIEDPTGRLAIKNTVSIARDLIPISKKDSYPKTVTGVATWPDIFERAQATTRFSVFVSGISDGYVKDDNGVIRRKTLQLNFRRSTDGRGIDTSDIKLDPERPYAWIYRSSSLKPKEKKDEQPEAKNDKNDVRRIIDGIDELPKKQNPK